MTETPTDMTALVARLRKVAGLRGLPERDADVLAICASYEAEKERAHEADARLPPEMPGCTIHFKECEKGHGWLTATNWVQHGCPTCERDALSARVAELEGALNPFGKSRKMFKGSQKYDDPNLSDSFGFEIIMATTEDGRCDFTLGQFRRARDVLSRKKTTTTPTT